MKKYSKMELFVKIVNGFQMLAIFSKCSILNGWQGSEYASDKIVKVNDKSNSVVVRLNQIMSELIILSKF